MAGIQVFDCRKHTLILKADHHTDVLISGAGPTGLMMACQLAIHHIPFRIIEKKANQTNYSGALIVHARTLELLHQMGIAEKAIHAGKIVHEIVIVFNGKRTFHIPVKNIGEGQSTFPFLLLLEQSKTEKMLSEFISTGGYMVERETELFDFTQDDQGVTARLHHDGNSETLRAKYLIAADGFQSQVRKQLAIPFKAMTSPEPLFITDCNARLQYDDNQICFSFAYGATTGLFPLSDGKWRIDGSIPGELIKKQGIEFNDIAESFSKRNNLEISLSEPQWFSIFHSHSGCASDFSQHRCFLTGDAAHVNTPVGAQGMNAGLQDACNLGWKLSLVLQNRAPDSILDSYAQERMRIARKVVRSSHSIFRFVTGTTFLNKFIRLFIIPALMMVFWPLITKNKIRQFLFSHISGISIRYRNSLLAAHASLGRFPSHAPVPGDRFPFITYQRGDREVNIQEKLKGSAFHLLVFSKGKMHGEWQQISEKYGTIINIENVSFNNETENIFQRLGIRNKGCYLVRPDMHIAYRSLKPDAGHFESYLRQLLK